MQVEWHSEDVAPDVGNQTGACNFFLKVFINAPRLQNNKSLHILQVSVNDIELASLKKCLVRVAVIRQQKINKDK